MKNLLSSKVLFIHNKSNLVVRNTEFNESWNFKILIVVNRKVPY